MLYTSYYRNIDFIKTLKDDYILVSISGGITKEIENSIDIWDKSLAPSYDIFKEHKESNSNDKYINYTKRFKSEILTKEDTLKSIEKYIDMSKDTNVVLFCYELPHQFCHRNIVSEFIQNEYNIEVNEIGLDSSYILKGYKYEKIGFNEDEF